MTIDYYYVLLNVTFLFVEYQCWRFRVH